MSVLMSAMTARARSATNFQFAIRQLVQAGTTQRIQVMLALSIAFDRYMVRNPSQGNVWLGAA
jgi:hypothetical protein